MKKILMFLMLGMFLISLASATVETLGVFKQNENINLIQSGAGLTECNISSVKYPDSTNALINAEMTYTNNEFNYTFNNASELGTYIVNGFCGNATDYVYWAYDFKVTYTGKEISSAQGIIYIGLFAVLFFVFMATLFGIDKLPRYNQQDEEGRILSVSYLKYFRPVLWFFEWMLFVAALYISSNLAFAYLNEELFAKILFVLFRITFGVTPIIVIVWMAWIFVSMFHDKELQKLLNRGIFPEGRLP